MSDIRRSKNTRGAFPFENLGGGFVVNGTHTPIYTIQKIIGGTFVLYGTHTDDYVFTLLKQLGGGYLCNKSSGYLLHLSNFLKNNFLFTVLNTLCSVSQMIFLRMILN